MKNDIINYEDLGFVFENETIWANSTQIAQIFRCSVDNIYLHVKNILSDNELNEDSSVKGKRDKLYNLDMIIAIGYRVNSRKATQFRQWATKTLSQYIKDGYIIDEKRLTQDPSKLNALAAKIRELRNNEKNIYQAVRDCFKLSAIDYDNQKKEEIHLFYSLLQDKFHYAILGMTAAKIKLDRANHTQENMGMQFFDGEVPTLTEAQIGKNYVLKDELYRMHLLSEQFLLYAESVALRNQKLTMQKLHSKLDELLKFNEYPVFDGYKVQLKDEAIEHIKNEYKLYEKIHKLKYIGIEVDLEAFYNGEYDDIYDENDLEHKRLSSLFKKYLEKQNNSIQIDNTQQEITSQRKQLKKYPTMQALTNNIKEDIVNKTFEKDLEKVAFTKIKS
jgi:hypothetical protein